MIRLKPNAELVLSPGWPPEAVETVRTLVHLLIDHGMPAYQADSGSDRAVCGGCGREGYGSPVYGHHPDCPIALALLAVGLAEAGDKVFEKGDPP